MRAVLFRIDERSMHGQVKTGRTYIYSINRMLLGDGKMADYGEEIKLKRFEACFKRGGTITGEHGVGKVRVDELLIQKNDIEMGLMKGIKALFDPKNLLNPDTVVSM